LLGLSAPLLANDDTRSSIALVEPTMDRNNGLLELSAGVNFNPGAEPLEALENGVALVIALQGRASRIHWLIAREKYRETRLFEIRYLPFSRHYQLTDLGSGERETFPRLSMVFDDLRRPRTLVPGLDADEAEAGSWQVQVRVYLDITRLPSPMRLPAWFSRDWRLSSRWHTWRFEVQ